MAQEARDVRGSGAPGLGWSHCTLAMAMADAWMLVPTGHGAQGRQQTEPHTYTAAPAEARD